MFRWGEQIRFDEATLLHGLAKLDLPEEPVAYISLTPEELAQRYGIQFQDSFDTLDHLQIAFLRLASGHRIALIHHRSLSEDQTGIFVDHADWRRSDFLDDVLRMLNIGPDELSWRQEWPLAVSVPLEPPAGKV